MISKEVSKHISRDRAEFGGITLDRKDRELIFSWFADTSYRNVTWVMLFVLRLGWPPVELFRGFVHPANE